MDSSKQYDRSTDRIDIAHDVRGVIGPANKFLLYLDLVRFLLLNIGVLLQKGQYLDKTEVTLSRYSIRPVLYVVYVRHGRDSGDFSIAAMDTVDPTTTISMLADLSPSYTQILFKYEWACNLTSSDVNTTRTAPNHSVVNPVERFMAAMNCSLNGPLHSNNDESDLIDDN